MKPYTKEINDGTVGQILLFFYTRVCKVIWARLFVTWACVAQWIKELTRNPKVVGSNPAVTNMLCS